MNRLIERARQTLADPKRRLAIGIGALAAIAVLGSLLPSAPPTPNSPGSYGMVEPSSIIRVIGSTVAVVALIVISLRLLRRAGVGRGPSGGAQMRVIETVPIGDRRVLYLLAVGGRRIVIGASPAGMSALGELDAEELEASGPGPEVPADFIDRLHAAAERRR